jgi:predicted AAA+ superfamily ATPase
MYRRLCKPLKERSFFLFGPRGVGKTWLLRELFPENIAGTPSNVSRVNLLEEQVYLEMLANPNRIRRYIQPLPSALQWIIIDEVQRVPALLHEVHDILEDPRYHDKVYFALTGSSARKLRRGGADLLAGRALVNNLYPLSHFETGEHWQLERVLNWGSLPAVVSATSDEIRSDILRAYIGTYIKEEIKEEQIVRKLEPFVRFLEAAAQANGELVTYSKIGTAALVDSKAVGRYFEILEDTLLGFFLPAYTRSARERAMTLSKFYFFDIGVKRAIERNLGTANKPLTSEWGRTFEHFIILENILLNSYFKRDAKFSQLRTKDGAEIDLIIEKGREAPLCREIKSSKTIPETEILKLIKITQAVPGGVPLIIYDGAAELNSSGVRIIPWQKFLRETWIDN